MIIEGVEIERQRGHLVFQVSRHLKEVVAVRLYVQPPWIHAPKQVVRWVSRDAVLARMTGLTICGREHDLAMEPFERQTIGNEACGQVVEQFRMSGLVSLHPEITLRGHQRLTEMPAPDPVHDHARRQRGALRED